MDCKKTERFLSGWNGGELPPEVSRHIESCERCRAELDEVGAALDGLRAMQPAEPPEGFWDSQRASIRTALEREIPVRPRGIKGLASLVPVPYVLMPAALVLVLLVASGIVGNWFGSPAGSTQSRLAALGNSVQAPLTTEMLESNAEPFINADAEESEVISMAIGQGYGNGDIYFDMYNLEPDELKSLYESLGDIEKQIPDSVSHKTSLIHETRRMIS